MKGRTGVRYSQELKQSIIERMMPPNNESVPNLCKELSISDDTLYTWRKEARKAGYASPGNDQTSDKWSSNEIMRLYSQVKIKKRQLC